MRTLLAALLLSSLMACSRADDKKDAPAREPEKPALGVGDPAPALKAGKWLNGPEVKGFEADKVYVVDFWAIWCGPCIQLMPHLSELREEYKDQGLVVVAATTTDQRNPLTAVQSFVEKRGPKLGFPFAVAETNDLDKAYMEAAKRDTLPSTFVIDKAGKIAFIGHPMQLDDVIPKVLDGTWKGKADAEAVLKLTDDLEAAFAKSDKDPAGALADLAAIETKFPHKQKQPTFQVTKVVLMAQAKKFDEARALTEAMLPKLAEKKNTTLLNNLRAVWADKDLNPEKKHVALAVQAAEAVLKVEGEKHPMALLGAADAHHAAGDKAKAVEFAEKSLKLAENDDQKKFIQQQLEKYKK
ncbi:MAG TPA: TlpA disulfide reductase family protein [Fimbriiglobus sp.]|jgi:thiol-disulfide isomerase/thioredoxin|nr:TlpA disulfide reductase family protein [Fimbriiglobus sp.]